MTLARVEDALQRRAVLYDKQRRPPLRLHLRLDQGHARLGSGRVAVLPGGDARGRRGPALHRAADGHPRLRGHRQRRPAARCRSPPRRPPRSSTSACPRRATRSRRPPSTSRWRPSPTPPGARSPRPQAHVREHGARPCRPGCAPGRGRARTGRLRQPAPPPRARRRRRSSLPEGVVGERFYEPDEAEAELARAARADSPGAGPRAAIIARDERTRPAMQTRRRSLTRRATRRRARLLGSVPVTRARARSTEVVAEVAKVQPLWALLRVEDRARYMRRMAQAVIDDFDELARALAREQGARARRSRRWSCCAAIDALIWIAEDGRRRAGRRRRAACTARCRWPSAPGSPTSPTASSA